MHHGQLCHKSGPDSINGLSITTHTHTHKTHTKGSCTFMSLARNLSTSACPIPPTNALSRARLVVVTEASRLASFANTHTHNTRIRAQGSLFVLSSPVWSHVFVRLHIGPFVRSFVRLSALSVHLSVSSSVSVSVRLCVCVCVSPSVFMCLSLSLSLSLSLALCPSVSLAVCTFAQSVRLTLFPMQQSCVQSSGLSCPLASGRSSGDMPRLCLQFAQRLMLATPVIR